IIGFPEGTATVNGGIFSRAATFFALIFPGDDAAAPAPTAAGSEPGRSASTDLTQLREQVHDLRSGSCPNPESAAATLADYATAAAAGGTYTAEVPLL
ncbi:hypothetical protein OJ584_10570, partial [Streptococcus anginosus]|uniref:hypothetical protein n=1 Tax=Streptococcus anginosus TaxID=1328 RepID=UPI00221F7BE9